MAKEIETTLARFEQKETKPEDIEYEISSETPEEWQNEK